MLCGGFSPTNSNSCFSAASEARIQNHLPAPGVKQTGKQRQYKKRNTKRLIFNGGKYLDISCNSANLRVGRNFMSDLLHIISPLRTQLKTLENNQGKNLEIIHENLNAVPEIYKTFEDSWVGGWGQANYNHYQNPRNHYERVQINEEYFYDIISKKLKINLDSIDKDILKNLEPFKKFQQHLITELSIIRDKENFNNENELLNSIEKFKWGFITSDYIQIRRPTQIPIYDMDVLSRGIETPPHITVIGYIVSLTTKAFSAKSFIEIANRLLRQVELKLNVKSIPDDFGYTEKVLSEVFDNFHSFCNQLKNRHNKRATIAILDEYDVQDLLHSILKLHFKDVREEEYTPSYAGSSTRMDFLLKNENLVIEVKKTRDKLTDKEIGEQLILDVAHYKNHPNCKFLKCFVYDPENKVKNPRGLESDLNKLSDDTFSVELFIRP